MNKKTEYGMGLASHAKAFGKMPNAAATMAALPVHQRNADTKTHAKTALIGKPFSSIFGP